MGRINNQFLKRFEGNSFTDFPSSQINYGPNLDPEKRQQKICSFSRAANNTSGQIENEIQLSEIEFNFDMKIAINFHLPFVVAGKGIISEKFSAKTSHVDSHPIPSEHFRAYFAQMFSYVLA